MPSTIPISSLIPIGVTLSPLAAQSQNLSSLLILSGSTVIDANQRLRPYSTLAAVAVDFGTSGPEYAEAALWFGQTPQPIGNLYIGRWVSAPSSGQLFGSPLTIAQQTMSNWTTVVAGTLTVTVDGTIKSLVALNFAAQTNLNGVATVITTALGASAVCTWNANYGTFIITSSTTGAASSVSFASAGTIAAQLGLTSVAGNGAYTVAGQLAETALSCVTLMDAQYGMQWYAVKLIGGADLDYVAIAGFVEASTNKHFQDITIQEQGVLVPGDTTDLGALLAAGNYTKTAWQYSSTSSAAFTSAMSRLLSVNYAGSKTTINLMWKQEPGVTPEYLNTAQAAAIKAKNGNVLAALSNGTNIVMPGVVAGGEWIDTIIGLDNFVITLQTALFNLQYTSLTKIGQDDEDIHQFVTCAESVCEQFVANGLLGPGVWSYPGVGAVVQGQMLTAGYYVFAQPVGTQTQASRAARVSPPITILVYIKGAVNTPNVQISVQQ